MIYLLLFNLFVGLIISYIVANKNILSPCVIAHLMFIFSTLIVAMTVDTEVYDISLVTIFVIMTTLVCVGIGEFVSTNITSRKFSSLRRVDREFPFIEIKGITYVVLLLITLMNTAYAWYKFDYIGSELGGSSFMIKYMLIRDMVVRDQNGDVAAIVVPYSSVLSFLGFFAKMVVFLFIYLSLYRKVFLGAKIRKYLYPILLYIPTILLSTTRSGFIEFFAVLGVMMFLMLKQKNGNWSSSASNKAMIKVSVKLMIIFFVLFGSVGLLKEQNVTENVGKALCAYAGASIIGLDQYLVGKIKMESDFPGQIIFAGVNSILSKFGFNLPQAQYHQDSFYYGIEQSNIFSAPYYILSDFGDFSFFFLCMYYIFWGYMLGRLMNRFKYGVIKYTHYFMYVLTGFLYYPVIMIAITEGFRHLIGAAFVYTLLSAWILQKLVINKNIKLQ